MAIEVAYDSGDNEITVTGVVDGSYTGTAGSFDFHERHMESGIFNAAWNAFLAVFEQSRMGTTVRWAAIEGALAMSLVIGLANETKHKCVLGALALPDWG